MNSIDPCNKLHMSNFLKDYSESQINQLLDTHKSLLLSSKEVKDMKYKTDEYTTCIDPIRKHNYYDKYQS